MVAPDADERPLERDLQVGEVVEEAGVDLPEFGQHVTSGELADRDRHRPSTQNVGSAGSPLTAAQE